MKKEDAIRLMIAGYKIEDEDGNVFYYDHSFEIFCEMKEGLEEDEEVDVSSISTFKLSAESSKKVKSMYEDDLIDRLDFLEHRAEIEIEAITEAIIRFRSEIEESDERIKKQNDFMLKYDDFVYRFDCLEKMMNEVITQTRRNK